MKLELVAQFDPMKDTSANADYVAVWNGTEVLRTGDYYELKEMTRPENIRGWTFWHPLYPEIMGVAVTAGLQVGDTFYPAEKFR